MDEIIIKIIRLFYTTNFEITYTRMFLMDEVEL